MTAIDYVRAQAGAGERVSASGADLVGADLSGADLSEADLSEADLSEANLSGADLSGANLSEADLRGADLYGVDLCAANLSEANLSGANLSAANLSAANLSWAKWHGLRIDGLPSRQATLTPTPDGWRLTIGCWAGTIDSLRDLIATDTGWPEADGDEIAHRRPHLTALADMCDAHTSYHADVIDQLAASWNVA